MRSFVVSLAAELSLALSVGTASAQRPNAPLPAQDTPVTNERCAAQDQTVTPSTPETRGQGSRNAGEQLAKSNGVICPPAGIDPEITTPPPGGGKTPVIPPPGTPGGNPNLIPK